MESFLAGRPTVAKLPSGGGKPASAGEGFSPLCAHRPARGGVARAPAVSGGGPEAPGAMLPKAAPPAPEPAAHTHKVSVEVVRVDGAVQGIVVTCKCGERIELDCVY